ncbi:hypothetical protein V2J09_021556 [Rumex salicifolius]
MWRDLDAISRAPTNAWFVWIRRRLYFTYYEITLGADIFGVPSNRLLIAEIGGREGREVMISWRKPDQGWVKLNTDGAVVGGRATTGGVIRDGNGHWLGGFVHNIGSCSVPTVGL